MLRTESSTLLFVLATFISIQCVHLEENRESNVDYKDDCTCVNGRCVKNSDEEYVCTCLPGWGLYLDYRCSVCNCGKDFNCTFDESFTQTCICPDGYKENNGICKEPCNGQSNCGEGEICDEQGFCNCKDGHEGRNCAEITGCKDLEPTCTNANAECIYDETVDIKANCRCLETDYGYDTISKTCKELCNQHTDCREREMCDERGFCICKDGYEGDNCAGITGCKDLEPTCSRAKAKCIYDESLPNKANCECLQVDNVYDLITKTCKDLCPWKFCKNGGTCRVENGTAKCSCTYGYYGDFCEIDLCPWKFCKNGGTCKVENGTAKCSCRESYYGEWCEKDPCSSQPCLNGGKCSVERGIVRCICSESYYGEWCEKYQCAKNFCQNGGTCLVRGHDQYCLCKEPFFGVACEIDPCTTNPCLNGGSCFVDGNTFKCFCKESYLGDRCETGDDRQGIITVLSVALVAVLLFFLINVMRSIFKNNQRLKMKLVEHEVYKYQSKVP